MPIVPPIRGLLLQVILPLLGWVLVCLGLVHLGMAYFPLPPFPHPILNPISPSVPISTHLWMSISCFVVGLGFIVGSKMAASRKSTGSLLGGERESTGPWRVLGSYENQVTAEALAEALRQGGVPARVEVDSPVPGFVEDVRVIVSAELHHRARWIVNQQSVSLSELEYAATGKLPGSEDAEA